MSRLEHARVGAESRARVLGAFKAAGLSNGPRALEAEAAHARWADAYAACVAEGEVDELLEAEQRLLEALVREPGQAGPSYRERVVAESKARVVAAVGQRSPSPVVARALDAHRVACVAFACWRSGTLAELNGAEQAALEATGRAEAVALGVSP